MAATRQNGSTAQSGLAYPYNSLQKCIDVARVVGDMGGVNGDVQRSVIAQGLGVEEGSNSLTVLLGASKLYDLLDGRGAYRLTETAKQYFHPTNPSDAVVAKLKMAKSPPLFSALIERFDGTRLPAQDMLVNLLNREYRITESWRTRAVQLFLSALKFADAVDASGFLRFKASLAAAGLGSIGGMNGTVPDAEKLSDSQDAPIAPQIAQPAINEVNVSSGSVNTWTFGTGKEVVRVQTSQDLSMDLWEKLEQYVRVLKPTQEQ
jgi:hypothetical protein